MAGSVNGQHFDYTGSGFVEAAMFTIPSYFTEIGLLVLCL